jgi:hypothetical protein
MTTTTAEHRSSRSRLPAVAQTATAVAPRAQALVLLLAQAVLLQVPSVRWTRC